MIVVFPGGRGGRETESLIRSLGAADLSGAVDLSGSAAGCELTSCCDRAVAAGKTNAAPHSINTAQVLFIWHTAPGAVLDSFLLNLDDPLPFPVAWAHAAKATIPQETIVDRSHPTKCATADARRL